MGLQLGGRALAPLRHAPTYRALLASQMVGMLGRWMVIIGAQWFMIDRAPDFVALVPTVTSIPVMVLGLGAGVAADRLDRARLIVVAFAGLTVGAMVLAVSVSAGFAQPWSVLTIVGMVAVWDTVNMPAWQSLQADVVAPSDLLQAATLTAVTANIGRIIGPAVAGVAIVVSGLNGILVISAAIYLAAFWMSRGIHHPYEAEKQSSTVLRSIRICGAFLRQSEPCRRVLVWTVIFFATNVSLLGLLPVLARDNLGFGAGGYAMLQVAAGVGAIGGATLMPRARDRLPPSQLFGINLGLVAVSIVAVAVLHQPILATAVMAIVGYASIGVIAMLNATLQTLLPSWVRSRGLSVFLVVSHAGLVLGGLTWGAVAAGTSASTSVAVSGIVMLAATPLLAAMPFPSTDSEATLAT